MDPLERRVAKQPRGTNRVGDDQRNPFSETTIKHVLVQGAGESSTTFLNRTRMVIFCTPALRTTAATSVDADHVDVLTTTLNNFTQRAKTTTEISPNLDKT